MKKIFLFAAVAMMAFASCGNRATESAEGLDTVAVEIETPAEATEVVASLKEQVESGDPEQIKLSLTSIQKMYEKFIKEGKLDEAKQYAATVQAFLKENSEAILSATGNNEAVKSLLDGVKSLPIAANATVEDAEKAAGALKTAVDALPEDLKAEIENKVNEAANEAVEQVKTEAKAKVDAKVEETKKKAADAASKAVSDAAKKLLGGE